MPLNFIIFRRTYEFQYHNERTCYAFLNYFSFYSLAAVLSSMYNAYTKLPFSNCPKLYFPWLYFKPIPLMNPPSNNPSYLTAFSYLQPSPFNLSFAYTPQLTSCSFLFKQKPRLEGLVGSLNANSILPLLRDFITKYDYYDLLLSIDVSDYLRSMLRLLLSFSQTYRWRQSSKEQQGNLLPITLNIYYYQLVSLWLIFFSLITSKMGAKL